MTLETNGAVKADAQPNGAAPRAATDEAAPQSNGNGAGRPSRHVNIAVIGTGFSGVGMAIKLKQAGRTDFAVFEKANDVGGTWRENTYPGIACDVPSNLYSFSFALNPNWSRSYSPGQEIWDYIRNTAKKFDVLKFIKFNTEVTDAAWDDEAQIWQLQTGAGPFTANFVIVAMGHLSEPLIPDLPGIDKFQGEAWHSQQWRHDVDLTGKRVAVVGTGASAIQFVPQIVDQVKELHLYQRTPPWILPRSERALTSFEHKLYRYLPFTQKLVRGMIYSAMETRVLGFVKHQRLMKVMQKVAELHIRSQVKDPELRKKVTPDYTIGCKRVLMANNWYPAIVKPNVEVITSGVSEVTEHSVLASDGTEREVDAIIWGTGFYTTTNPAWDHFRGRDGRTLTETWAPRGMEAMLGMVTPNFPNMFIMLGPNSGLGHSSMVYQAESEIDWILQALRFARKNNVGSLEVTREAMDAFEDSVMAKMKDTVWVSGGCSSWYIDEHGRNTTLWPGFTFEYRRECRKFDPAKLIVRDRAGNAMTPVDAPARAAVPATA